MLNQDAQQAAEKRRVLVHALVILPAVFLGILAMISGGVPLMLWGQQAAAFAVFAALGLLGRKARKIPSCVWAAVLVLALAAAFLFPGAGGARRWLDLGVFNVNAAMLTLPALIVLMGDMACPYPALLCAAVVLTFQPDASQLAALAAAALPVLWRHKEKPVMPAVSLLALAACMIRAFSAPVHMEPVAYCEGVLAMLGDMSLPLMVAGAAALVLVPAYFLYRYVTGKDIRMLSLAAYYAAAMLFGVSGEYPAPLMGFGLSPIAGYWLADWLMPLNSGAETE